MPLCLLEAPEFNLHHLQLEPGDLLVLYTDGILEAKNADGVQFGQERLRNTLKDAALRSPRATVNRLVKEVHAFTQNMPQHDDLTVLALRYTGRQRSSVKDRSATIL